MIIELDGKKIIIGILIVVVIILLAGLIYTAFYQNGDQQQVRINDLNIEQDQLGLYKLKGHITPLKDFDYLEARIVFYDEHNTVVGQSLAWNMVNPTKDTTIDVGSGPGGICSGIPKYAVVSFYDNAAAKDAIANFTVYLNATNKTDSNDTSSDTSSSSSDSPSVYAYKSDGTPMYSKTEADNYMLNKYGTDDYERQSNGYIDPSSVGGRDSRR